MISVASVLWNEAANIDRYLHDVMALVEPGLVSDLVVIDQSSTDGTWERLRAFEKVLHGTTKCLYEFRRKEHAGFCEAHRQLSISLCRRDWVLVLDADEWIEPWAPVADLIRQAEERGAVAITLPTYNHVIDLPGEPRMQHFGEERHFRLVKRGRVDWPTNVHATPVITGPTMDAPDDVFVHHRWRLHAQPAKIARQVEFTRKQSGDAEAERLKAWLEENYAAFRRELGVE